MKKYLLLIILAVFSTTEIFAQFPHQNINLLSIWDNPSVVGEPVYGIRYQGCWGWADTSNGKEYAIIGASKPGTYIIEVTNPFAPVQRAYIPGIGNANTSIWHEIKSYGKYLYIASDDGGPNTFQIADMSYLPDSVHIVHNDSTIFKRSHTIYVDGNKLYCGSVGRPGNVHYSMAVYSLANPALPQLLRALDQDYPAISYVHDMFVRNDTVYASCGTQGLYIFKFNTGSNTFTMLGNLPNPSGNYNHSSFLTDDGQTLINCEEVPTGLPVKMVDVSDVTNPGIITTFSSASGATPHNPYIKNGRAVIAWYQDGIQVYDISVPSAPVRIGYFDTDTLTGSGAYSGCWGAYTDLPSNVILASDMQNGLFVLEANNILTVGMEAAASPEQTSTVYPNPARNNIFIDYGCDRDMPAVISVVDINGKTVLSRREKLWKGKNHFTVDVSPSAEGIYAVTLSGNAGVISTGKFIRAK